MNLKNLTRPLYTSFIDNTLITIFKRREWNIASINTKREKIISTFALGFERPIRATSSQHIFAVQDSKSRIFFFDKDLSLVKRLDKYINKSTLIKFIKELNSFVLIDTFLKKSYFLDLSTGNLKNGHELNFIGLDFTNFQDFDFFDGKYFLLNQSKAQVIVGNIYNSQVTKFLKFGRGGYGYARDPSSINIIDGEIFINDLKNYLIQKFDSNYEFINQIGSKGDGDYEFDLSYFSSFDQNNKRLICSDFNNDRVISLNLKLDNFELILKGKYEDGFYRRPSSIDFDKKGNCFIANRSSGNIFLANKDLNFITNINLNKTLHRPACIGILCNYVNPLMAIIERKMSKSVLSIFEISNDRRSLTMIKKIDHLNINDPQDMIVSKKGIIYIADTLNRRILRVNLEEDAWKDVDLTNLSNNKKILIKTVSVNNKGEIFTADFNYFKIYKFDEKLNFICEYDLSYLKREHKVIRAIGFCKDKIFLGTRGRNQVIFWDSEKKLENKFNINYVKSNWNNPVKIISYNDNVYFADKENDRVVGYNIVAKKIFGI